jgi:nitrogen regulatory protein P-II 1
MKIITAMIQPFMLNKVTSALKAIEGFPGMTVTEAQGFGRRRSLHERRAPDIEEFKDKTRIEIVTPDEKARRIVETLVRAARTNVSGDGKVHVLPVESGVRVQTGETADRPPDASLTFIIFNDFRVFQSRRISAFALVVASVSYKSDKEQTFGSAVYGRWLRGHQPLQFGRGAKSMAATLPGTERPPASQRGGSG